MTQRIVVNIHSGRLFTWSYRLAELKESMDQLCILWFLVYAYRRRAQQHFLTGFSYWWPSPFPPLNEKKLYRD